jgi:hypothetical protein
MYHGHHGIQTIIRDIGPGGGWPTLIKTNYIEWVTVMSVRLQVRHMWEAVRYGDIDYYEDRRALDAVFAFQEADYLGGLGHHHSGTHRQRPCPQNHAADTSQGVGEPNLQAR